MLVHDVRDHGRTILMGSSNSKAVKPNSVHRDLVGRV